MEVATAQVASTVLVTAILAPLLATFVLKRQGGSHAEEEQPADADDRSVEHGGAERRADGAAAHDEPKL